MLKPHICSKYNIDFLCYYLIQTIKNLCLFSSPLSLPLVSSEGRVLDRSFHLSLSFHNSFFSTFINPMPLFFSISFSACSSRRHLGHPHDLLLSSNTFLGNLILSICLTWPYHSTLSANSYCKPSIFKTFLTSIFRILSFVSYL